MELLECPKVAQVQGWGSLPGGPTGVHRVGTLSPTPGLLGRGEELEVSDLISGTRVTKPP